MITGGATAVPIIQEVTGISNYMYERARRFGCSKSGIEAALKRLGISKKKTLGNHPKHKTLIK
ncbi:hypothetical protein [Psychrobacter urativorans]|uniref:hypothetical protein n=1 Tax=Psychrobacter urativorans TaxID=45610 RepID=UPI0019182A92|nr:hypothetical protein [Psychrobacter urativorans]